MNFNTGISGAIPKILLSLGQSFYIEDVIDRLRDENLLTSDGADDSATDQLSIEVSDYLSKLVWLGVLWKSGECYLFRSRPRGHLLQSEQAAVA